MKPKNKSKRENYLDKVPKKNPLLSWNADDEGIVTLKKENVGAFNFIAQKLIKKPRFSYIHLDAVGSFIWILIDGRRDTFEIGKAVSEKFGADAEPLYERLIQYISILKNNEFIEFQGGERK